MIEKPFEGRARFDYDGMGLRITIPSKKNWFVILFFCAWLGGWFMGEFTTLNEVLTSKNMGENGFLIFWLTGWTFGGLFAVAVLLWTLLGRETILIANGFFKITKGILALNIISRSYDANSIKNLELNPQPEVNSLFGQKKKMGDFWGITGGKLRFDYGMKTIRFAIGIDEAEARFLIDEMKKRGYYREK